MKIAMLGNEYPSPSQTFIREEVRGLEGAGLEVARVAIRRSRVPLVDDADRREATRTVTLLEHGRPWSVARGVARLPATVRAAHGLFRATRHRAVAHLAYAAEAALLWRAVERAGAEWVHVHHGSNAAAAAAIMREAGGPPWSVSVHGPEDFEAGARASLVWKLARADLIVGETRYCAARLRELAGSEGAQRLRLVRCGVAPEFLAARPSPCPDEPRLVCVGRLVERKGHAVLIRALAAVRARFPSARLEIIGGGPEEERLRALAADLGVSQQVEFAGWADAARVRAALERSRALVLASFAEGLPVVLMEAMALGRPVIATGVGGVHELVEPERTGWLAVASSVESLAGALAQALQATAAHLSAMGARGRAAVEERHDAARNAATLADHIRDLVRRARGARGGTLRSRATEAADRLR